MGRTRKRWKKYWDTVTDEGGLIGWVRNGHKYKTKN